MSLLRRVLNLFSRSKVDREIADEIQAHLQLRVDDNIAAGMTPDEALRNARLRFGNVTSMKERVTAADAVLRVDALWSDLRFSFRQLVKARSFTVAAVLTLALGIGANIAIFSMVNAFLLRPLGYPQEHRLVMLWEELKVLGITRFPTPIGNFIDYQKENHSFEQLAAVENAHYVLRGGSTSERVFALRVTANLFPIVALKPALGRTLVAADNLPGHEHVAVLSDGVWRENFGADPAILGKSVVLDDQNYEVVGVMGRDVRFTVGQPQSPQVWVPLPLVPDPDRRIGQLHVIGRLREGISLAQAQADMSNVADRLEQEFHIQRGPHGEDPGYGVWLLPLREELVGNLRQSLLRMLLATGLIFLVACVNVANLMLAHGISRDRELMIRSSLGANRIQLIRPLVLQAMVLSLLGTMAGLAVGAMTSKVLVHLSPYGMAKLFPPSVDWKVLLFASLIAFLSVVMIGVLPAIRISRRRAVVKGNAHQILGERRSSRVRKVLVIGETALSVALVIAAGLLLHSFLRLRQVPLGFHPDHLLTARISLPHAYATAVQQREFVVSFLQQSSSLHEVEFLSLTTLLPVADHPDHAPFSIEGRPWQPFGANRVPQFMSHQAISTNYFRTMQIPLLAGRPFAEQDSPDRQKVAIVNRTLVRGFWPDENPLGKHIIPGAPRPEGWLTVVGVVDDVRTAGINAEAMPEIYTPLSQAPAPEVSIVARLRGGEEAAAPEALRAALQRVDAQTPLYELATYDEILSGQLGPRRFEMLLLSSMGVLALILAAVGLYGVVSYSVSQRAGEMGLRMAFGAMRRDVVRLVVRQTVFLSVYGLLLGLLLAVALRKLIADSLFQVSFLDLPVYVGVIVTLFLVSLGAAYFPARRAASANPVEVLRAE